MTNNNLITVMPIKKTYEDPYDKNYPKYPGQSITVKVSPPLKCEIYGPPLFLTTISQLLGKIAIEPEGRRLLANIAGINKPLIIVKKTKNKPIATLTVSEDCGFWQTILGHCGFKMSIVDFDERGYQGNINIQRFSTPYREEQIPSEPDLTLAHELYHIWQHYQPVKVPKIREQEIPRPMLSPSGRREVFAVRYINQIRKKRGYIRSHSGTYPLYQVDEVKYHK